MHNRGTGGQHLFDLTGKTCSIHDYYRSVATPFFLLLESACQNRVLAAPTLHIHINSIIMITAVFQGSCFLRQVSPCRPVPTSSECMCVDRLMRLAQLDLWRNRYPEIGAENTLFSVRACVCYNKHKFCAIKWPDFARSVTTAITVRCIYYA